MSAEMILRIRCDTCGRQFHTSVLAEDEARILLAKVGWKTLNDAQDFCVRCARGSEMMMRDADNGETVGQ